MIKPLSIVATAVTAVGLALVASCNAKPPKGSAPQVAPANLTACPTRTPFEPTPLRVPPPPTAGANTGQAIMTIETNLGLIEIDIDRAKIPCTTAFLQHLGASGMYQGTACHRLTTEGIWILQCGDPSESGWGGPGFSYDTEGLPSPSPEPTSSCKPFALPTGDGTTIWVEPGELASMFPGLHTIFPTNYPGFPSGMPDFVPFSPDPCYNPPVYPEMLYGQGVVAMANTGRPGSTGSQFFFAYRDFRLRAAYTVLGQVRTGMDIILRVAADGTADDSTDGKPRTRLVITKMTVR